MKSARDPRCKSVELGAKALNSPGNRQDADDVIDNAVDHDRWQGTFGWFGQTPDSGIQIWKKRLVRCDLHETSCYRDSLSVPSVASPCNHWLA